MLQRFSRGWSGGAVMFVAMNNFRVRKDREGEFERLWKKGAAFQVRRRL